MSTASLHAAGSWRDTPGATLAGWIAVSLLVHAAVVTWVKIAPSLREPAPPVPLEIRLDPVKPPEPVAIPEPKPQSRQDRRPEPRPVEPVRIAPVERAPAEPVPAPILVPPVPEPPPAPVREVRPEAPPAAQAEEPDPNALAGYGKTIGGVVTKYREYPRIAQIRGWQGRVLVRIHFARKGVVTNMTVVESSGHAVLDQQALDMLKRASPFPPAPQSLEGREFSVTVPIVFRLENS